MSVWDSYPEDYRKREIQAILRVIRGGECVSLVGLSGAGKTNLLRYLTYNWPLLGEKNDVRFDLIDCNSLEQINRHSLFRAISTSLGHVVESSVELIDLQEIVGRVLKESQQKLCLVFDRFDVFEGSDDELIYNNLRVLRDTYKYQLMYMIALRRILPPDNELAELFFANTLWLGPLSQSDSVWNVQRYADRLGLHWNEEITDTLIQMSWGYPSMLRAVCEAYAALETLEMPELVAYPSVQQRIREFWADKPDSDTLERVGLLNHPILMVNRTHEFDTSGLTVKEHILLTYFLNHPNIVCEKDDLIQEIWSEDAVFEQGVRDDSLAQLVRRLRKKIEPDSSNPQFIHTVPGRGYRFTP